MHFGQPVLHGVIITPWSSGRVSSGAGQTSPMEESPLKKSF